MSDGVREVVRSRRAAPWRRRVRALLLEPTLRRIPGGPGVLDLCCGWGFYFSINPAASGIDGDPDAVAWLRARGHDVVLGNVLAPLPWPDASFRTVIAHDVLEHFSEPEMRRIAGEVRRVLRPGGDFVVLVPNRRGFDAGVRAGIGHVTFVGPPEIARMAEGSFAVERQYAEPLPRGPGRFFTHNKEVFVLRRG